MAKTKEEIRVDLIVKARELLVDKGLDFLTARNFPIIPDTRWEQFIISLKVWIT